MTRRLIRVTRQDCEGCEYVERIYREGDALAVYLPHRWAKDPTCRVVADGGRVYAHDKGRVQLWPRFN